MVDVGRVARTDALYLLVIIWASVRGHSWRGSHNPPGVQRAEDAAWRKRNPAAETHPDLLRRTEQNDLTHGEGSYRKQDIVELPQPDRCSTSSCANHSSIVVDCSSLRQPAPSTPVLLAARTARFGELFCRGGRHLLPNFTIPTPSQPKTRGICDYGFGLHRCSRSASRPMVTVTRLGAAAKGNIISPLTGRWCCLPVHVTSRNPEMPRSFHYGDKVPRSRPRIAETVAPANHQSRPGHLVHHGKWGNHGAPPLGAR